jgi:hypothetical protein
MGVRAGHRASRQLHIVEREAVEGHQMTLSTGQLLNHGQWAELPFWIVSGWRRWVPLRQPRLGAGQITLLKPCQIRLQFTDAAASRSHYG